MSTSDPRHYDVILSPVITEKATMASEHNKVVFKVRRDATKPQIKEAVEKLFDVKVKNVIALIKYQDGELAYILAPQRLAAGDQVIASERADVKPGNAMPIGNIPVGTIVHNIEIKIGKGGQIAVSYTHLRAHETG